VVLLVPTARLLLHNISVDLRFRIHVNSATGLTVYLYSCVQRISSEASSVNRGWSVNRSEEECATRQPWKTDDTYGILLHITRCTYLVLKIKSRPVAKTVLIASNPRKTS